VDVTVELNRRDPVPAPNSFTAISFVTPRDVVCIAKHAYRECDHAGFQTRASELSVILLST
jgi:hypothetical protein